jgi:tetratricopeptide (TPR) repeat protein
MEPVENCSDDLKKLIEKSETLSSEGRYDEALEAINMAIELKPDTFDDWFDIGFCLKKFDQYEESLRAFDNAIEIKHDDSHAWHFKGENLGSLKRFSEAIKAFENAINLNSKEPGHWFKKGFYLRLMDCHREAIKALDRAIEIEPYNPEFWWIKHSCLDALNLDREALIAIEKAIMLKPNGTRYWIAKGSSLYKLDQYAEAAEALEKGIQIDPDTDPLYTEMKYRAREKAANLKYSRNTGKNYRNYYQDKLHNPMWQKKRLEVLENANWRCQVCGNVKEELQVHHSYYEKNRDPWDYPNSTLLALCKSCHEKNSK